jgi:hypothetical protein
MAEQVLVGQPPRELAPRQTARPLPRKRRARLEVTPSGATLMFRWMILCSILLLAVWAFLGTSPE